MGQKINPIGFRLSLQRNWISRWYANDKNFPSLLTEDIKIRKLIKKKLHHASVSKVIIERPAKNARITIMSSRPGLIIGKKGEDIEILRSELEKLMQIPVHLNIEEVKIMSSGRLNGIEIARTEWYREGRVPLHTLRADLDYATSEAKTTYGIIGIKVWIYKGSSLQSKLLESELNSKGSVS